MAQEEWCAMANTLDRRPIAARDFSLARSIASWLVRRGASPNDISLAGLVFGVAAGATLGAVWWAPAAAMVFWLIGAVLVQLRLAANMLDGMVAVAQGITSPIGELYNEVPDRLSDAAILIGVGIAAGGNWALGLAAALAAMATAYVRAVGKSAGAASEFSGPMAKQQRMFLVTALALWSALGPANWQPELFGFTLPTLVLVVIIAGAIATAVRRLCRIARSLPRAPSP